MSNVNSYTYAEMETLAHMAATIGHCEIPDDRWEQMDGSTGIYALLIDKAREWETEHARLAREQGKSLMDYWDGHPDGLWMIALDKWMSIHLLPELHIPQILTVPKDEGFGWVINLASDYGWVDAFGSAVEGEWTPEEADACEQSAIDHLEDRFVTLRYEGED
jgi:hypothetical protein